MRETEYAFAVAKIRANEVSLLKQSNIEALISAENVEAAMKILSDLGFGDFSEANQEEILSLKEREALNLVREIAPDDSLLNFLIVKNDFHNCKAILKAMVMNTEAQKYYLYPSVTEPEAIKKAIEQKDYSSLPDYLTDAVKTGYELITSTLDGQLLDVTLDRLALEAAIKMAEQTDEDFALGLSNLNAAIGDIKTVYRAARMGKSLDFILQALAKCSYLDTKNLAKSAVKGQDELCRYIESCGFKDMAEALSISDTAFEREADNQLLDYVSIARYKSFGISPLIAYYLARVSEIKTVRIILSCKRCFMSNDQIRERVRKLYV